LFVLNVSRYPAETAANLSPYHGDPFDRLLMAQAGIEDLRLLTRDKQLKAYGPVVRCV